MYYGNFDDNMYSFERNNFLEENKLNEDKNDDGSIKEIIYQAIKICFLYENQSTDEKEEDENHLFFNPPKENKTNESSDRVKKLTNFNNTQKEKYNVSKINIAHKDTLPKKKFFDIKKIKRFNYGRKKKAETGNGKHNKKSGDNIINKLKGYCINHYLIDIFKKNSIQRKYILKKLPRKFIEDLSKEKNKQLFSKKIKEILSEEKITSKNKKSDKYENKIIIERIIKNRNEVKLSKILELTFKELFILFRKKISENEDEVELRKIVNKIEGLDLLEGKNNYKDMEYLIQEIRQKNDEMNEEELERYIDKLKFLCRNYEQWFIKKKKRISKNS